MPLPGRPARTTRLANARVAARLSQAGLAKLTGISTSTIQRIERGTKDPTVRELAQFALVLDCELGKLVEEEWLSWDTRRRATRPDEDEIADIRAESFKTNPSLNRPKIPARDLEPMSPFERQRREWLSEIAREREARKREQRQRQAEQ